MTQTQKEFLLTFFLNDKFPGWKNIATNLIENGFSIVAGSECIWKGGMGNFITIEETSKEYIGCVKYVFNLSEFLKSEWFKSNLNNKKEDVKTKILELKTQLEGVELELMELRML